MTKEQEFAKRHAERLLVMAKAVADSRSELSDTALRLYGKESTAWIAGGFQEHWPEVVKDTIRKHAQLFGELVNRSLHLWIEAGCRLETWRRKKDSLGVFHY